MPSTSASSRRPIASNLLSPRPCHHHRLNRKPWRLEPRNLGATDQPLNPFHPTDSSHPQTCERRCIDRSDRQLANSTNPTRRQSCPTPRSEWSPAERAVRIWVRTLQGATRPFVDVQSVLLSPRLIAVPCLHTVGISNQTNTKPNSIRPLTGREVLVEGLGRSVRRFEGRGTRRCRSCVVTEPAWRGRRQ